MRSGAAVLSLVVEDEPPSRERLRRRVEAETVREGPDTSFRFEESPALFGMQKKIGGGVVPSCRYVLGCSRTGRMPWSR